MSRKKDLDNFHYFEVLDRAFMVSKLIDTAFEGHPVFDKHEEAKELYEKAAESMGDLYQLIGNLMPEDESD